MVRSWRWSSPLFALGALLVAASRADGAVSAQVVSNVLNVSADDAVNSLTIRVAAGDPGRVEVLDGTTVIRSFARSTFNVIEIYGEGGNDTILLSSVNGPITEPAVIHGGAGNDTITGGAGNDTIFGDADNDTIFWHAEGGSDIVNGEGGIDALQVNGADTAENFAVSPNGARVRLTRGGVAMMDIGTTETLIVNANGGDDTIGCSGDLAPLIGLRLEGGDGNDLVTGSNGPDLIIGGDGNDSLAGLVNDDTVFAGAGDDFIVWNPGQGNDIVEGQVGTDRIVFNGSDVSENFTILRNGGRVSLLRDVSSITIDINDIEIVELLAFGGVDSVVTTLDLSGTDVMQIILDGGDGPDVLFGASTNDIIRGGAGADQVFGEGGNDTISGGLDDDAFVDGGPGNDTIVWNVGDGIETAEGRTGTDTLLVNGTNLNERFGVGTSGALARVTWEAGMSFTAVLGDSIEAVEVSSGGGNDQVSTAPNLTGVIDITVDLGAGADLLNARASSRVTANGSTEFDTLEFDAEHQLVTTTPSTIAVGGTTRVTHSNVEQVTVQNAPNPPPTITITTPTANPQTTATTPFVLLAGTAADEGGITSVTWHNSRTSVGGTAIGTTSWSVPNLALSRGLNTITVTTTDAAGNQASDTLAVVVDTFSYTMAEGATGGFFDTDILLANPNVVPAPVVITYSRGDGTTITQNLDLAPTSRTTIALDSVAGLEAAEVSTTITSTEARPLVVERTMRWDASGYGAHTERASDAPATSWFFAEGSQGFFETYVLLANPATVSNEATITFLLENGAPVVKTFALPPTSRQTIGTNSIPELLNQSFGIAVAFTQPGVAERAMYFSTPGTPIFNAGHESAGVNAPSTSWFLAEGATGSFFTTFVLLANPGTSDATATVTFLPATGSPVTKTHVVPAGRRLTLNIAAEDALLADAAVATQVIATQPILVERAQYWPFAPHQWYEAHNSFGGTALDTKWGLAEGRVGGPEAYQTYILLANADTAQAAQVAITFLRTNGTTVTKTYAVPPTSRFNVHVNSMVPELANESFGAVVEVTSGPGIFVERALYSDSNGLAFAAGTNALATRLPPAAPQP
jgi:hypothetical protein